MADRTAKILDYFEQINAIPRCSGNEARLCLWLQQWAIARNLAFQIDNAGNLVICVPASPGHDAAPGVVLQGHMDMVCEKTPESRHDFSTDPIVSHKEGEWLTADDTTLGADNGIALAYMLALAEEPSLVHPPLELLFTVDEETGLNGAKSLKSDFICGRILINLDSEDEGVFTIGCAGGVDTAVTLHVDTEAIPAEARLFKLVVGGLKGGHSGIDIHKHRGNANKIMARTLERISAVSAMGLVSLTGGSRKNAIPRDAQAMIWIEADKETLVGTTVRELEQTIKAEFAISDEGLHITSNPLLDPCSENQALTRQAARKAIWLLLGLPNGVADMSAKLPGLVETSSNLATMDIKGNQLTVVCSQRSATISRLDEITASVRAVGELAGAAVDDKDAYPPWQPVTGSALLSHARKIYHQLYGKDPVIQVIHAGLECAIIGDICPGMDMISFGPTMCNPHSPDERLYIPSIAQVWDFLIALLKEMCA